MSEKKSGFENKDVVLKWIQEHKRNVDVDNIDTNTVGGEEITGQFYFLFGFFNRFLFDNELRRIHIIVKKRFGGKEAKYAMFGGYVRHNLLSEIKILYGEGAKYYTLEDLCYVLLHQMVFHKMSKTCLDLTRNRMFVEEMAKFGVICEEETSDKGFSVEVLKEGRLAYYVALLRESGFSLLEYDCGNGFYTVLKKKEWKQLYDGFLGRDERGKLTGFRYVRELYNEDWVASVIVEKIDVGIALENWLDNLCDSYCKKYTDAVGSVYYPEPEKDVYDEEDEKDDSLIEPVFSVLFPEFKENGEPLYNPGDNYNGKLVDSKTLTDIGLADIVTDVESLKACCAVCYEAYGEKGVLKAVLSLFKYAVFAGRRKGKGGRKGRKECCGLQHMLEHVYVFIMNVFDGFGKE